MHIREVKHESMGPRGVVYEEKEETVPKQCSEISFKMRALSPMELDGKRASRCGKIK